MKNLGGMKELNESIDYRAIVKWIRASQDAKSLRRLRKIIDERIHTLRTQGLRDWTKDDVDEFWRACSALYSMIRWP